MKIDNFYDNGYEQEKGDYLILCDYGPPEGLRISAQLCSLNDAIRHASKGNEYGQLSLVKIVEFDTKENE